MIKEWLLACSIDGIDIYFETVLKSETEPSFWECYDIAEQHGSSFWTLIELGRL